MRIEDFDYDLPEASIAQEPLESREDARMMAIDRATGSIRHDRFRNLPERLSPDDCLVVNDARVFPARLLGMDARGRKCEILLVSEMEEGTWSAMVRPGKRVRPGVRIEIAPDAFHIEVLHDLGEGRRLVRLEADGPVAEAIERHGHTPLPPYIRRPDRPEDRERYQTVFAEHPGAVAAPTAGLHFDRPVLDALAARGIDVVRATLQVGPATFQPVREADPRDHTMEGESFCLTAAAAERINAARAGGGAVVAVGTTVTRLLETVADGDGCVMEAAGETDLFIHPPYAFRAVDRLVTNFHLPRSTLLMLVAAFAGRDRILDAYREAIREGYRFYSYGDVMLIR